MAGNVIMVVVPLLAAWAWSAHRPAEPALRRFARRYGVVLDASSRPFLQDRIRRSRCWRAAGGSIGWLLASLPVIVTMVRPEIAGRFARAGLDAALPIGYLLGAVTAELAMASRRGPRPAVARLRPRHVADYVPGWPMALLRGGALATVLVAPLRWIEADWDSMFATSRVEVVRQVAVTLVGLALVEITVRVIAHRRQQVTAVELLPVDEALRADAARRVTGIGMVVLASAGVVAVTGAVAPLVGGWVVFSGLSTYVFLGLWWALLDSPWRLPDEAAV